MRLHKIGRITDQEGNIPANKLMMIGTLAVVFGSMIASEVFAAHRSHSSHKSHSSHSSGSHENHSNHSSHESHQSHQSHTSHSNTASHSNSLYSAEGNVKYSAPSASAIPGISVPAVENAQEAFALPKVNQNIEIPNTTPTSGSMPSLGVPATSVEARIDVGNIHTPSATEKIR